MFTSIKNLIDSRLGKGRVIDDFDTGQGYFVKVPQKHLHAVAFFLKNDPDVRLNLLDHVILLPPGSLTWAKPTDLSVVQAFVLYQLKSQKLPYRVTLVIEITHDQIMLLSLATIFPGARWPERDIMRELGMPLDETMLF